MNQNTAGKPKPNHWLLWSVAALLLLAVTATLGFRAGQSRGIDQGVAKQKLLDQQAADRDAAGDAELRRRVVELEEQQQIDAYTIDNLHQQLASAARERQQEQRELELYRRIEQNTQSTGLVLDEIRARSQANAKPVIELTLLQYRGRRRVQGSLGIRVLASDSDKAEALTVFSAGKAGAPAFNLRFFETLSIELPPEALSGFADPWIEITVKPEDSAHKSSVTRVVWSELLAR